MSFLDFGRKEPMVETVDSLIEDLSGKVVALQSLAQDKRTGIEETEKQITELEALNYAAGVEAVRADSIAQKILALLS